MSLSSILQREYGGLQEELRDDTANAEDVHGPGHARTRRLSRLEKTFWGEVACPATRRVEVKRKLRGIVQG